MSRTRNDAQAVERRRQLARLRAAAISPAETAFYEQGAKDIPKDIPKDVFLDSSLADEPIYVICSGPARWLCSLGVGHVHGPQEEQ